MQNINSIAFHQKLNNLSPNTLKKSGVLYSCQNSKLLSMACEQRQPRNEHSQDGS